MSELSDATIPPGWVGGFAGSNPAFAYPTPDLTSLPLLDNMANIDLLDRMQQVKWPEFSWQTIVGNEKSRCFQQFAPNISRLGYTDAGRIYSIICPQQGACSPNLGCFNVEVTVTGQRGWANEDNRQVAAEMTVEAKIWFTPSTKLMNPLVQLLWAFLIYNQRPFPKDKAHAIRVKTYRRDQPDVPIFPVRRDESELFKSPGFALHPEAWAVGNIEVEIGQIEPSGDALVDDFNQLVMLAFNYASGNMLAPGNLLTWNLWFHEPELVDREEWRHHAEVWRKSIDADHGSPDGEGTSARYFDGTPFKPGQKDVDAEVDAIVGFLKRHMFESSAKLPSPTPDVRSFLGGCSLADVPSGD